MMDIIELAIASGMQVTLDGRIGTQEYRSVYGSLQALRRFAEALLVKGSLVVDRETLTEAGSRTESLSNQGREVRNDF
jgi:hypothetical protein